MKTKHLSILALGTVLCMLLASCNGLDKAGENASGAGSSSAASASSSAENKAPSQTKLRWLNSIDTGYAAEKGFYRVKSIVGEDSASTRISYIDYASKTEVPLCNQPQCDHNNERCAAMLFADGFIQTGIFGMDGSLFLLSSKQLKSPAGADDGGFVQMRNTMALYQMNADGTGRTEVLEIGEEYDLGGSMAAGNGLIFLSAVKTVADAVVAQPVVLQIDPARGSVEELQFGGMMCGVYNETIVISKTGYGDLRGMSDAEAMAAIRNSKNTIVTYTPATGETKEHAAIPANDCIYSFIDGTRLIYTPGSDALYFVDLETDETGTLTEKLPGRFSTFSQADGKLGCSFDDGAELNAQTGSRYLVRSDVVEKEEYVSWAGSNQITIVSEGYALIDKQAYWAGRAEYEPIAMLD